MPQSNEVNASNQAPSNKFSGLINALKIVALIYLLLLAVGMIGSGFKWAVGGKEAAAELFEFATNPILGLLIGILATALVQSSSTVTSVIVGLVAGGLPVAQAIPMVMGANIGTTVTNTLVSLAHMKNKGEFRRAFAAATVHDFFNLILVVIFLPLEIIFGIFEKMSAWLAAMLVGGESMSIKGFNFIKPITKPVIGEIKEWLSFLPAEFGGALLAVLGILVIFGCITMLGKILKVVMVGRAKDILHSAIGRGPVSGVAAGTAITVLVQSSSTTTSLVVPFAGSGVFKLKDIYPFTLGSNIGTTITALLASTAVSGEFAMVALQIALVHLMYNTLGVIMVLGIPFLRNLPIKGAEKLADIACERHSLAALYVFSVFFLIPGLFVLISSFI